MYQFTQHKFWGVLALIISIMFVAFVVTGCGGGNDDDDDDTVTTNDDDDDDDVGPPDAQDVTVTPAPGGAAIPSNTQFTLKFDAGVDAATVNGAAATGSGDSWTATVPGLAEGPGQSLNIGWTNRSGTAGSKAVGPYEIDDPDTDPPEIKTGTVAEGAADVDPAPINAGGFRFDFSEEVTGSVKLTDEAGADLNWIATVQGATATLTAVAGQELANETTYKVDIDVQDAAGNPLKTTLTFVTKPKE